MTKTEYTLGDYRAPLSDISFTLQHAAGASRLENFDGEFAAEIMEHAAKFVEGVIAPTEPALDSQPPRLENGRIKVSPLIVQNAKAFVDGGWYGLNMPEEFDGQGLPSVLTHSLFEMISGASLNTFMNISCATAALKLLLSSGTDAQKSKYIPAIMNGEFNATIVLSEPQAGSDLRLVRTLAKPNDDGSWTLQGSKVFCSGADQDINPNILHCILARTEEAPGLSLFLCPAVLPDGERNSITVTRVEEKMGIHASPTCQVNFDEANAEIVGAPGEGLQRMFTMMNAMRLDVAVQGLGMCQVALQRSMAYAESRIQGRSISTEATSTEAISIDHHGDIKRQLLTQDALTKGARALIYKTAVELELDERSKLAAFLLPVCKVFTSDASCEAADMAIQIHGGYGFVSDYQVEQIYRDARILRIFEGANGLHATNLATSLRKPRGMENAQAFEQDVMVAIQSSDAAMVTALTDTLEDWRRSRDHIAAMTDPGHVAYDFMNLTGLLAFAASWSRLESAADNAEDPEHIRALAEFVRTRMLPKTSYLAQQITRD